MTDAATLGEQVEREALDSLLSDVCPMCKTVKKPRQSFCLGCYRKLPRDVQASLYKRFHQGYVANWLRAKAILKEMP